MTTEYLVQLAEFENEMLREFDVRQPWTAIVSLRSVLEVKLMDGKSYIDPTAYVHPAANVIQSYVGPGARVFEGATVRESIVFPEATVGHGSEVARSLIGSRAMIPRMNYVGSSILGTDVQLGGTTMFASRRHSRSEVHIAWGSKIVGSNTDQFGAIVGDRSIIAYSCHVNPGTVIGHDSIIFPFVDVTGFIPPGTITRSRLRSITIRRPGNMEVSIK